MPTLLITVKKGNKLKVKPLPGQNADGEVGDYNPEGNVQCDRAIRERFPVGTIFAVNGLDSAGNFYRSYGGMRVATKQQIEKYMKSTGHRSFDDFKNSVKYEVKLPDGMKQKLFEVDLTQTDVTILEIF